MASATVRKPTVFVVDDEAAVRQALRALLSVEGFPVEVFESGEAFLAGLPPRPVGCVLLDLRMPGLSGLDVLRELKGRGVALPVIMITAHGDVPMAVAALKAGAADFLEKPFDREPILAAIGEALQPKASPSAADRDRLAAKMALLTQREREVMELVVAGQTNKMIAHRLDIAVRTVEIHRSRVMEKTGAASLSELVRMAVRLEG